MKKLILLLLLTTTSLWAKPVVLVSYYDPFANAPFNNSETVAKALQGKISDSVTIKLCRLNTVFDKAYAQIEDCIKALKERPVMVIGLGEAFCGVKVEIAARNYDKTKGPDNEGNERNGEIIRNAPANISMRYPLPQMYCSLTPDDRSELQVSNSAGSFVCNNTAYQLNHYHPDLQFGFIHVPSHNCRDLGKKNEYAVRVLTTMISKGVEYLSTQFLVSPNTPHTSNELRMPILKNEIYGMRNAYKRSDKCMNEFFKKTVGVDERGFWSF
ncbi:MAG TPA: hypothetical protein VNJ08_03140 [Bacteriovoracaceae bacterium]|nr:hypothetical protein [Bacteriovoracaceae bacterium]